jgi:hypothetical protein
MLYAGFKLILFMYCLNGFMLFIQRNCCTLVSVAVFAQDLIVVLSCVCAEERTEHRVDKTRTV